MPIRNRFTRWRPAIRSRHPSHDILRRENKTLPLLPFKSVIRFGSSKEFTDGRIELNTVEAIKNSSNKLLMKLCFEQDQVKTADWCVADENNTSQSIIDRVDNFGYPVISKHIFGSRGTGNKKHDNQESLEAWMEGKDLSKYIFEKYYSYNREYRLHISKNGCFYTCRKMLQADAPQDVRWYRNDAHCNWILENNELFDKPVNWDEVIEESVKALKAVGLDIGAVDLRIQSAKNKDGDLRESPKFIVVEINSAASMAEITGQKYIEELPKLLMDKYENL